MRIDAHTHMIGDAKPALDLLASHDLKCMNICCPDDLNGPWQEVELPGYARVARDWPERYDWCTSFDVPRADNPGYVEKVIAGLENDLDRRGAIACKLYYNIGEVAKKADGTLWQMDDPLFDPIFRWLEKRHCPVVWHFGGDEGARQRVLERYRGIRFIGAHLGTLPDCLLPEIAGLLDRNPNYAVDTAATVRRLLKQDPVKVRDFFIKYQDRILFGTDLGCFEEVIAIPFTMMAPERLAACMVELKFAYETQFGYYEKEGPVTVFEWGTFKGMGLHLPEPVLEKFYRSNALEWIPGLA